MAKSLTVGRKAPQAPGGKKKAQKLHKIDMPLTTRRQRYLIDRAAAKVGLDPSVWVRTIALEAADWEPPQQTEYPAEPGKIDTRFDPDQFHAIKLAMRRAGETKKASWLRGIVSKRAGWNPETDPDLDPAPPKRKSKPAVGKR